MMGGRKGKKQEEGREGAALCQRRVVAGHHYR